MPKFEHWDFLLSKEVKTLPEKVWPIEFCSQRSIHTCPIVPILSNQRTASGKKKMENHSVLSMHPHNFHCPHSQEPPPKCQHVVKKEMQEGIDHHVINCHIPLYHDPYTTAIGSTLSIISCIDDFI